MKAYASAADPSQSINIWTSETLGLKEGEQGSLSGKWGWGQESCWARNVRREMCGAKCVVRMCGTTCAVRMRGAKVRCECAARNVGANVRYECAVRMCGTKCSLRVCGADVRHDMCGANVRCECARRNVRLCANVRCECAVRIDGTNIFNFKDLRVQECYVC